MSMEEPYYDYYEADINAKLQGVLVEELTPLQSTLEAKKAKIMTMFLIFLPIIILKKLP